MSDEEILDMGRVELQDLIIELNRQKDNKFDLIVESERMTAMTIVDYEADEQPQHLGIRLPVGEGEETEMRTFMMTDYGHRQLSEKMGIPLKYYERMNTGGHTALLAHNINEWIGTRQVRFVRILDNKIRAILSNRYKIMDHFGVLTMAAEKANEYNVQVMSARLSETRMYVKMVLPFDEHEIRAGDTVVPGIVISNSEVGAGAFKAEMFLWRRLCNNGMIGTGNVSNKHLGASQDVGKVSQETMNAEVELVKNQIRDMVETVFDSEQVKLWVEQLKQSTRMTLDNPSRAVENVVKEFSIPEHKQESILNELINSGGNTKYDLLQAITRTAADENPDNNADMERIAGKLSQMDEKSFTYIVDKNGE